MPNLAHLVSVLFGLSRALQLQCEVCLFELRIDCRATFFYTGNVVEECEKGECMKNRIMAIPEREFQHIRLSVTSDNFGQDWDEIAFGLNGDAIIQLIAIHPDEIKTKVHREFLNKVKTIMRERICLDNKEVPEWLTREWINMAFVAFHDAQVEIYHR